MRGKQIAGAVMSLVAFGGCAGAAHNVPVQALREQNVAQVGQDQDECEATAKQAAANRDLAYAACMVARGYRVYVAVPARVGMLQVDVEAVDRALPPGTALRDLSQCGDAVTAEMAFSKQSTGSKAAEITGFVINPLGLVSGGHATMQLDAAQRSYVDCLDSRGYKVTRWSPPR